MAEIETEMLRVKNGENLVKSREHVTSIKPELDENKSRNDLENYKKKDDVVNMDDKLVESRKKNQDSRDIDKMWNTLVRCDDDGDDDKADDADDNNGKDENGKKLVEKVTNEIGTSIIDDNLVEVENGETYDEELDLDLAEPTPEVMEYAKRELGETDEVKCQTLQELRDMIYERGECNPHRMDDAFLIRFLRARNFNVNRAHRLVVRYFDFKESHPNIHKNVDPLQMRHIGDDDVMTVPAYRTQCGRRLMIYRMGNWDPKKYGIEEIFKATVIILELGAMEPRAQVLGGVVIFDLENIAMAHAWSITPQIAAMVMALMVTSFPMKTHAIHIIHQSWVFDMIYAMFKPLLNKEMQQRVFFHGDDMTSLHNHVAPTSLPKKYGGTRDELPYYKWIDSLSMKPKIVKEMHSLGYIVPEEMLKTTEGL